MNNNAQFSIKVTIGNTRGRLKRYYRFKTRNHKMQPFYFFIIKMPAHPKKEASSTLAPNQPIAFIGSLVKICQAHDKRLTFPHARHLR
jgi:hypothetical protein